MAAGRNIARTSNLTKFDNANLPEPSEFPPFMVLELNRYYPEPGLRKRYGIDMYRFWDVFDITLSDGVHKMIFVLTADARLNKKVIPGYLVQLKKFARYWKEECIGAEPVIVIQEIEVVNEEPQRYYAGYNNLPWIEAGTSRQREITPLASSRSYYMDNWTFNIASKSLESDVQHIKVSSIDMSEVHPIREVMNKKMPHFAKPALLVKVMRKSRLVHYVTHSRDDKWPFLLPLMVADRSGWCSAVLWNKLGPQIVNQIHEGGLLFLKNFRVKPSAQQKTKSFFNPPQGTNVFSYELSLDSTYPATDFQLVTYDSDDDIESLQFPVLESCFMTRKDVISVPDFSTVDVAGLITFVGRVEREPKKGPGSPPYDSGAFFYRRWVHLLDTSLSDPIITLIYSGEQIDTFLGLIPGHYLLCRHMLTNQRLDDLISSRQRRHGWLTTTTYSWLYVFNPSNLKNLPESLIDIVKTSVPEHVSDNSHLFMEGGFFRYPPFPFSLESLKKSNSEVLDMIIPSNQWKEVFNKMTWRECHQLAVHATLMSIMFTEVAKKRETAIRCSQRKKARLDQSTPANISQASVVTDTMHLGSRKPDDLSELWPSAIGSRSKPNSGLLIQWQGLSDPVILTTVKPFALNTLGKIGSFVELVSGVHDSVLGVTDCARSELAKEEVKAVTDSARALTNGRFFLLLDVYTNSDARQLVVLNRAFHA